MGEFKKQAEEGNTDMRQKEEKREKVRPPSEDILYLKSLPLLSQKIPEFRKELEEKVRRSEEWLQANQEGDARAFMSDNEKRTRIKFLEIRKRLIRYLEEMPTQPTDVQDFIEKLR